ncbi:MAG: AraC family transcriptional regulator [Ruminococcaceae bacterium]|nr:AraC family transcriptional regulator [Oscillospiraceae bacterium]
MVLDTNSDYIIRRMSIHPSDIKTFIPTARDNGRLTSTVNFYLYIYEGELIYSINDKTHIVGPHQLAFFPKNTPYFQYATISKELKAVEGNLSMYFNDENECVFDFFDLSPEDYVITIADWERLEACFDSFLHDPGFTNSISYQLNRVSKMAEILAIYFENLQKRAKNASAWKPVLSFMAENLSENISIDSMANLVYLHPNYFMRKFKKAFGVSPIKYYNDLRLEKAIQLLADTDLPSTDVAAAIGIDDPNYFSYFFKTATGLSPRKFKGFLRQMHGQSEDVLYFN